MELNIHNWRWEGVPFFVRAGKNLPTSAMEVRVRLRQPPRLFSDASPFDHNYFRFEISPDFQISTGVRVKQVGTEMVGEPAEMTFVSQSGDQMMPYERLLGDALRGDRTLFARQDGVEAAWAIVDEALRTSAPAMDYAPGTWGPELAAQIPASHGGWISPEPR